MLLHVLLCVRCAFHPQVRAPTRPHPEIPSAALPAPFLENQLAATKLVDASLDQARMPALAPTAVGLSPLASAAVMSSAMDSPTSGLGSAGGGGSVGGGVVPPQSLGLPAMQATAGQGAVEADSVANMGGGVMGAQFMGMGGTAPTGVVSSDSAAAAPSAAAGADDDDDAGDDRMGRGADAGFGSEISGLLADDAGPLGAGVDAEAVPYPHGISAGGMGEGVSNLVPASEAGAAAVPDYTDVGVGGVAGVPTDDDGEGVDTEMGAAGGMPGDLTAVVNAPVEPAVAAEGGGMGGVGVGGAAIGGGGGRNVGVKPTGGDFADDIGGTDVEAVKDVGQQELAPAGHVEEAV